MIGRSRGAKWILGEEVVGLLDGVGGWVAGRKVLGFILLRLMMLVRVVWVAVHRCEG